MNPRRAKRPRPECIVESEEKYGEGVATKQVRTHESTSEGANRLPWPEGAALEPRVEMGSALLSSHGAFDSVDL